jgi:hypothetical protein
MQVVIFTPSRLVCVQFNVFRALEPVEINGGATCYYIFEVNGDKLFNSFFLTVQQLPL